MLILAKNILGWKGFTSWKFWVGIAFTAIFTVLMLNNINLGSQLKDSERERAVVEQQLGTTLDRNEELNKALARLRIGQVVDEQIVIGNQAEIDKLRNEHEERVQEVNRQKPSGPASAAVICAITRVCD